MRNWLVLAMLVAAMLAGVFLYNVVRWRRAPVAFRALNLVAGLSATAGLLLGICAVNIVVPHHWFSGNRSGSGDSASSSTETVVGCPGAGISAKQVGKAIVEWDQKQANNPLSVSSSTAAQLCKGDLEDGKDPMCVAASLARHAYGEDMKFGDHRTLIPCTEVADFCDQGALAKDSDPCRAAYEDRNTHIETAR